MTKEDFVKIIFPLAEYYGKELKEMAIKVYYDAVKEFPASDFEVLVKKHMADTDQGRFFPLVAHLLAQVGDESAVRVQAAMDFDVNPRIDGTITFDAQKETVAMRAERKRRYIEVAVFQWKQQTPVEKLAGCISQQGARLTHHE